MNHKKPPGLLGDLLKPFIALMVLTLIGISGYRCGDLSYTLYRLHYRGQLARGTVTEREVGGVGSTRYILSYTFLGVKGQSHVSVDMYRSNHIGSDMTILYDPENLSRSWPADGRSTLFWGALLFAGTFSLVSAASIWELVYRKRLHESCPQSLTHGEALGSVACALTRSYKSG